MAILVTGGAGYIGSHTTVQLLEAGYDVVILDNFHNSHEEAVNRIQELTGKDLALIRGDINCQVTLESIFTNYRIDAVIHFAGLKAVGESNRIPLTYYRVNVAGTLSLCETMRKHGCGNLVFSSSATVYGNPGTIPIPESCRTSATNPYGRSKLMAEEILADLQKSQPDFWNITLLRYFNPIGAHPSGRIGEDPNDIPNNLLPYVAQVATGRLETVNVFGNDYDTPDGTGVRDYIHVSDLADGHVSALTGFLRHSGVQVFNLGTGQGYSVLDMIRAFEHVTGQRVPYRVVSRRDGDVATCYADVGRAREKLGWQAGQGLEAMVADAWRWQQQNPQGFGIDR